MLVINFVNNILNLLCTYFHYCNYKRRTANSAQVMPLQRKERMIQGYFSFLALTCSYKRDWTFHSDLDGRNAFWKYLTISSALRSSYMAYKAPNPTCCLGRSRLSSHELSDVLKLYPGCSPMMLCNWQMLHETQPCQQHYTQIGYSLNRCFLCPISEAKWVWGIWTIVTSTKTKVGWRCENHSGSADLVNVWVRYPGRGYHEFII